MDQVKIGKFIAECRKEENLTQSQLAVKLNITDKAISKWETGRSLPDSSIMLELCSILKISVNELLSGQRLKVEEVNNKSDEMLLEIIKEKEEADKRLLMVEYFIGIISCVILFGLIAIAAFIEMKDSIRLLLILIGFMLSIVGFLIALRIEQVAGYYECKKCAHRYIPTYLAVNKAPHFGRKRYMKCPHCGQKSWNNKVLSK